jgi:hypothetical protein
LIFPTFISNFKFQDFLGFVSKENQLFSKPENINLGKEKEDVE